MRDPANIRQLAEVGPDFMGMIFYPKSPRYVHSLLDFTDFPESIARVGVFVKASTAEILEKVQDYGLQWVQLHGGESVAQVVELRSSGLHVIKVFSIGDELPIKEMEPFVGATDYFLFDTKSTGYGGSGHQFNWEMLRNYHFRTPYFLSGGVDLADLERIVALRLPGLFALDVNSRFETAPGLKDIDKIKQLKSIL